MQRIAIFPGTFDPITVGHLEIIHRALPLFDQIVVSIGQNINKVCLYSLEQRLGWIREIFKDEPRVSASNYEGLTVDFCKKMNAGYILRGLRSSTDYQFEKSIAQVNRAMNEKVETVFFISDPALSAISSSIVRDIIRNGGDASAFVPKEVVIPRMQV
jgi:pantetheine-phosphate adenylyltransferase